MQACSSAGYQDAGEAVPCSEELPVTLTVLVFSLLPGCNTPTKGSLGVQGVYVVFQVPAHHGVKPGQDTKQKLQGNSVHSLVQAQAHLSFLHRAQPTCSGMDATHSGLGSATSVND